RYGDTPLGMVESALEFATIARDVDYHDFIFSMKASNPKIMIAAYRLLVARLNELGPDWNYPLHLGVTEAGEGEDARIKSAIGIAKLHSDGVPQVVTVRDVVDLPVISASRLLADKLQPRHPILLKDLSNCTASVSALESLRTSQKRPTNFLETLLTAATNIGS